MKTTVTRKTTRELIDAGDNAPTSSPLPLSVIPNYMGINLCSIEALSWEKREDGQLVELTIHFIPAEES